VRPLIGGVLLVVWVGSCLSAIMSVAMLGTGGILCVWSDVWCGGVSFRVRFSRLFDLSVSKGESVFEMLQLGWGEGGEAWR